MGKMNIPNAPKSYTTQYKNLKGVDFSCDQTEVDARRTPTGANMISDEGGNPIKRLGWRKIANVNCGRIMEIIFHEDNESEYAPLKTYVIGETGIYAVVNGGSQVITMLSMNITSSSHFLFNGEVYAFIGTTSLTGNKLYKLKGVTASPVDDEAYIPEVTISKNPNGTGGVSLESVNILTQKRKFAFLGNDTDTEYYLYPQSVRDDLRYKYIVFDSIKVEVRTTSGWQDFTSYVRPDSQVVQGLNALGKEENFVVCEAKITLNVPQAPLTAGQDNVRIIFEPFDMTEKDGIKQGQYKESKIDLLNTTCCDTYGYGAIDRVFVVGGNNKNRVYYSAVNKPLYYPDNNYIVVGHDSNGIIGMQKVSSYLAVIKEDSQTEATVFLISGSQYGDNTYFQVTPTSANAGGIATKSFSTLIDEPLFLTRDGIYAIASYYVTTEKVLRNRSYFVDKKLTKEPNLDKACAIVWRRYYILCVNDNCYILDGRNKANDYRNNSDYLYEAYYWENVPAKVFCVYNNELYFGDADGHLCKFNTDITNRTAYCDDGDLEPNGMALTNGKAIECEWSTPLDSDGKPQYFKNLNKKGTLLTMQPHDRTSAKITLVKDGDNYEYLGEFYADIQNWELVDFSRFTFNSNNTAQDAFMKKKIKKYKRLQIVVKNDAIYEPFGILGIIKTYTLNNFSKNRG